MHHGNGCGGAANLLKTFGGPAGNRTLDTKIKSLVLYQLSYRPIAQRRLHCSAVMVKRGTAHGTAPLTH
jgi:hypothetical protein